MAVIHSESKIRWPRELVYRAYRDRLPAIARHIPDIREIRVRSREDRPTGPKIHNEWVAGREIPSYAKPFVKPEHLRWDDFADWDDAGFHVDWVIKTRTFTEQVHCSGRNAFFEDGTGTRVLLTGELRIAVQDVPGVPRFLGKRVAPDVERFVVALVTPNLEKVNGAIQAFLDADST